jgi:hypothetical protein
MKVICSLVSLTIAAALAVPALAQPKPKPPGPVTYKCVDSRGKIYYSDQFTPECGQTQEMNRQGRILRKAETTRPGPAAKAPAGETGEAKQSSESQRRDRALTATYTSEEEIDLARDRSLAIPLQAVKTSEKKLAKVDNQLLELKSQADALAGQQKAIPPHLLEEIDVRQKEVSALGAEVQQKKSYADSVRARYEADKVRYRELKTAGK